MRKIKRPRLRARDDDANHGDPHFLLGDIKDDDLSETGLAHSFNHELDIIVHGRMLIRGNIVEADGMVGAALRLQR